jgi:hypothetical protein
VCTYTAHCTLHRAKLFAEKSASYETDLMASVIAVTKEEALAALTKYLVPLFDTASSTLTVVTPTNKVEVTAKAFDARVVQEDALEAAFPPLCTASGSSSSPPPPAAASLAPASKVAKVAVAPGKKSSEQAAQLSLDHRFLSISICAMLHAPALASWTVATDYDNMVAAALI